MNELIKILELIFVLSCVLCIPLYIAHEYNSEKAIRSFKYKYHYYRKVMIYRNLIIVCFSLSLSILIALIFMIFNKI